MKPQRIDRRVLAIAITVLTVASSLLLAPWAMAAKGVDTSSKQAYLKSVAPLAQASMKKYGVPASVAIAQSIQESSWGKSSLSLEGNAYFGIKCSSQSQYSNGCVTKQTWEVVNGKKIVIDAKFRRYPKPENSFLDHGLFLKSKDRYAAAFKYTKQPKQFIREVHKAGYATDPNYTNAITKLMDQYNLYQYDKVTTTTSPTKKPTVTKSPTKKPTAKPTATKSPTGKPTAKPTPKQTASPKPTATRSPTDKPTGKPTPKQTATPKPTASPKPTPKATATPKATPPVTSSPEPTTQPTSEPTSEPTTGPEPTTDPTSEPVPTEPTEPSDPTEPVNPEQPADPEKELPPDVPAPAPVADSKSSGGYPTGGYPETTGGLASTGV